MTRPPDDCSCPSWNQLRCLINIQQKTEKVAKVTVGKTVDRQVGFLWVLLFPRTVPVDECVPQICPQCVVVCPVMEQHLIWGVP